MKNLQNVFRRHCLQLAMAALAACALPAWAQADAPAVPQAVPSDVRCPVCGMYPARYPQWAAQLRYRDGAVRYFDSPVEMLAFLADVPRYDKAHTLDDVQARWLSDASGSGQWIVFEHAWLVHGSDMQGPMRSPDLPAFPSEEAAQHFTKEHGGHAVKATDVPPDVVQSLTHKRSSSHEGHEGHEHHEHGAHGAHGGHAAHTAHTASASAHAASHPHAGASAPASAASAASAPMHDHAHQRHHHHQ